MNEKCECNTDSCEVHPGEFSCANASFVEVKRAAEPVYTDHDVFTLCRPCWDDTLKNEPEGKYEVVEG
jgi:hypothetical protein